VLAGTRGLVCNKRKKNAHEHTGISRGIRPSLRNGLTAYNALSLETNSSCLHRWRIDDPPTPGWARQISASLTPATGARTTRLRRTQLRRSSGTLASLTGKPALLSPSRARRFRVHRSPAQRPWRSRYAPLAGRDGSGSRTDLGFARSGFFFRRGLDRANQLERM